MRSRFHPGCLLSIVITCALGCGASGPKEPAAPSAPVTPAQVVDEARRTLDQYKQAYQGRSMDAIAPLYAHSPELVLTRQGHSIVGWQGVEAHLRPIMSKAKDVRLDVRDVYVAALGSNGAVVTAVVSRTIGDGITSVREDGTLTLTLHRHEDRWLIMSEHFSFLSSAF